MVPKQQTPHRLSLLSVHLLRLLLCNLPYDLSHPYTQLPSHPILWPDLRLTKKRQKKLKICQILQLDPLI